VLNKYLRFEFYFDFIENQFKDLFKRKLKNIELFMRRLFSFFIVSMKLASIFGSAVKI